MSKTLLIPDVHERPDLLQKLESRIDKADRVVCLGDFFDAFTPEAWVDTIKWIHSHIDDPRFDFIIGNHDASYFFDHQWFCCSGFKLHKRQPIRDALLDEVKAGRFKLETRVGPYCVSHAGWHPTTLKYRNEEAVKEAFDRALRGEWHPIWGAGFERGGMEPIGGPIWLDWTKEFVDIPEFAQIVGHTAAFNVRQKGKSYCIDTHLQKVVWYDDEFPEDLSLKVEFTDEALN